MHIEVKTTSQSVSEYDRFWLSENEVQQAQSDPHWQIWRVWDIDSNPNHEDLGNIITSTHDKWDRSPASWLVKRK